MELVFTTESTRGTPDIVINYFINVIEPKINNVINYNLFNVGINTFGVVYDVRDPEFYRDAPQLHNCQDHARYSRKYKIIEVTVCCEDYQAFVNARQEEAIEILCLAVLRAIRLSKRIRLKAFDRKSFYEDMVKLFLEEGWIRDPKLILPFESFF